MKLKIFSASVVILIVWSFVVGTVSANKSSFINATVNVSICGNQIIEGGEDCEGSNLNGKSCKDVGFGGGTLSCDVSCGFDTSGCIPTTPTPTQVPTSASHSQSDSSSHTDNSFQGSLTLVPTNVRNKTVVKNLPVLVQLFGDPKNGTISSGQLRTVLSEWVKSWRQTSASSVAGSAKVAATATCDSDHNGVCDIRDFSVLLYYVK